MDARRLSEWLSTAEGLTKVGAAALVALGALGSTAAGFLQTVANALDLPSYAVGLLVAVLFLGMGVFLLRDYRRFARDSRLEQPDRFTLVASTPESLIGRTEDLDHLVRAVVRNRLVLLDGESGCGKSALVGAGLLPRLRPGDGLLPVLVRDWGDDWVRGPLAATLDALHGELSAEERARIGWSGAPDLAAGPDALTEELTQRLAAVKDVLGRRPLLIADQFDDYQAQHRRKFLDDEGNWCAPDDLATRNPFWHLVGAGLRNSSLHLLAVTRGDTASGLSCLRFLEPAMTASRTLPRVEDAYLGPLLTGVAPDDAMPPVVSNPANGWHALRDQLQLDLRRRGAILMQQVRTVLLGLRSLPVLTPRAYRRVGELEGVETLVVRRALEATGEALGGGDHGVRTARRLLGALILPGGPDQPPKAQRQTFEALVALVGNSEQATRALLALQSRDIVRPVGREAAWQLDHDYLARAVLTEARQADRWGSRLVEGYVQFKDARGSWRRRLDALLPTGVQARLLWERLRGRLRYREAAGYARLSAVKPASLVTVLLLGGWGAYTLERDLTLGRSAQALANRFGTGDPAVALEVWRASESLRLRLLTLVTQDHALLGSAAAVGWPAAHAGLEPDRALELLPLFRVRLGREGSSRVYAALVNSYAKMADWLTDPVVLRKEVAALRGLLERAENNEFVMHLAVAYTKMADRLTDPAALREEATALRDRLEREGSGSIASSLADAYAAVASRLADPAALREAAVALGDRLEREEGDIFVYSLASAYTEVASRLTDPAALRKAAAVLRGRLEGKRGEQFNTMRAYAVVVDSLTDPASLSEEAAALRSRLDREVNSGSVDRLARAYAVVAGRLTDPVVLREGAAALRSRLEREEDEESAISLAVAYAAVAGRLTDPAALREETAVLRGLLESEKNSFVAFTFAEAYAAVAVRLTDPAALREAAVALRGRLKRESDNVVAANDRIVIALAEGYAGLAKAYAAVAGRLTDLSALREETAALRSQMEREEHSLLAAILVEAYGAVAGQVTDSVALRETAMVLRSRLEREGNSVVTTTLARAYAAFASRLADPAALREAAAVLRGSLERGADDWIVENIADAYAVVASRLTDPAALREATAVLRGQLMKRKMDGWGAKKLADAYAAVAGRLTDPKALREEAAALRGQMEREGRSLRLENLAQGYSTVMAAWLQRRERLEGNEVEIVREILTMIGHPHLSDATPLLATLESLAVPRKVDDIPTAVAWWVERYGGRVTMLRPPLPDDPGPR